MKVEAILSVKDVRRMLAIFMLACLICTFGVADFFLKYLYQPVNRHGAFEILGLGVVKSLPVSMMLISLLLAKARFIRIAGVVFTVMFFVVSSVEIWMQYNFHMAIGGNWLPLILSSSTQEVVEFISGYMTLPGLVGSLAWIMAMTFVCWSISLVHPMAKRRVAIAVFFAGLCAFLAIDVIFKGSLNLSAVTFWKATLKSYVEERALKSCREYSVPDFVKGDSPVLGVIVIGESATRNHMSLYGYQRETTPRLDAIRDELIVFSNLTANVLETRVALRYLFTDATLPNKGKVNITLSKLCKKTNASSVLISNQGHWGGFDSVEDLIFYFCDKKIYCSELGLPPPVYDNAIVLPLKNCMEIFSTCERSVYFLHLYGSHSPFDCRCPEAERIFEDDLCDKLSSSVPTGHRRRKYNQYDNSIGFTDKILGEIIDDVRKYRKPSFVLYLSDHGESPSAEGWRVATDKDCWDIPLVIWLSPEYFSSYPDVVAYLARRCDAAVSSVDMLNIFIKLLLITGYEKEGH